MEEPLQLGEPCNSVGLRVITRGDSGSGGDGGLEAAPALPTRLQRHRGAEITYTALQQTRSRPLGLSPRTHRLFAGFLGLGTRLMVDRDTVDAKERRQRAGEGSSPAVPR